MKITDEVMTVLNDCTLENGVLTLPAQLDRPLYVATNKILEAMGGKWNRKAKGHTFERDPSELLENALRTGQVIDPKKQFQFFETPALLASRMVKAAGGVMLAGKRILEPSAGNGAILRAIWNQTAGPDCCQVVAFELNPLCVDRLQEDRKLRLGATAGNFGIIPADFLQCAATDLPFDCAIMNPPFSRNQDIAHVRHAYTFIKPGGRIVAIMSEHAFFANDKPSVDFREQFVELPGCSTEKLPSGTFSDTGVNSRLVIIEKPKSAKLAPPIAGEADTEYETRLDAQRTTLQFGHASHRRLDTGRRPITEAPLFGGAAQQELFSK